MFKPKYKKIVEAIKPILRSNDVHLSFIWYKILLQRSYNNIKSFDEIEMNLDKEKNIVYAIYISLSNLYT